MDIICQPASVGTTQKYYKIMAHAIFITGGKQYRVTVGDVLNVDRISGLTTDGETSFDQVLMIEDESSSTIGTPTVAGASVTAKVLDAEARGPKGVAFKFKRRKGYHKKKGFRASLTRIEITGIKA